MHSYQITRYELRIRFAEKSVGLWLLLSNAEGEDIYIAHQGINDDLVKILNIKFSEKDTSVLLQMRLLINQFEQKSITFNELIYYNKLINKQLKA